MEEVQPLHGENTELVYHSNKIDGALFGFNEEDQMDGKIFRQKDGARSPRDNTVCVIRAAMLLQNSILVTSMEL